uniref:ATP synthase F0 subunit 8 n=1 Tax=Pauropus longiramus TaxID=933850 RepID=G9BG42_9MYRI|nr:ATP synthase F0 subunit 8 [Pauropus longiramus]ADT63080.1 ATP synthase F0 subunit 8 [Pauropus longiramus]
MPQMSPLLWFLAPLMIFFVISSSSMMSKKAAPNTLIFNSKLTENKIFWTW